MFSQAFFEIQHCKNSISISLGQQRQEQSNPSREVECNEKRGQFFNQIFSHKICVNELQHNRFVNNSQKLIFGVMVVIGHQMFCPLWILLNGTVCFANKCKTWNIFVDRITRITMRNSAGMCRRGFRNFHIPFHRNPRIETFIFSFYLFLQSPFKKIGHHITSPIEYF